MVVGFEVMMVGDLKVVIPRWIYAYLAFLALIGVVFAVMLVVVLAGGDVGGALMGGVDADYPLYLLLARTLGVLVLFGLGFVWRQPLFVLFLLLVRLFTDSLDLIFILVLGFMVDAGDPLGVALGDFSPLGAGVWNVVVFVVLGLLAFTLPSAVAVAVVIRRIRRADA